MHDTEDLALYIGFKKEMAERLSPGQIAAQAAHAASEAAWFNMGSMEYADWIRSPTSSPIMPDINRPFGITLIGIMDSPEKLDEIGKPMGSWKAVLDPYVHFFDDEGRRYTEYDVTTCYWRLLPLYDERLEKVKFKLLSNEYRSAQS